MSFLPPSYNPTIGLTSLPWRKELPGPGGTLFGSNYPTMLEHIDIDLVVCKVEITGLETEATHQAVRMERLQQELRIAKELAAIVQNI